MFSVVYLIAQQVLTGEACKTFMTYINYHDSLRPTILYMQMETG